MKNQNLDRGIGTWMPKRKQKCPKITQNMASFQHFPVFAQKLWIPRPFHDQCLRTRKNKGELVFPSTVHCSGGVTPLGPGEPQFLRRFHCIIFFRKKQPVKRRISHRMSRNQWKYELCCIRGKAQLKVVIEFVWFDESRRRSHRNSITTFNCAFPRMQHNLG